MARPWHRHYPQGMPASLDYPEVPLHRFLEDSAKRFAERAAIVYFDGPSGQELSSKSYGALNDESSSFAAALIASGINPGDRVAYFLPNSPELVVAFHGIIKAGAVAVPCNPTYLEQELGHQLRDSGAKAFICDPKLLDLAQRVIPQTAVEQIIVAGGSDSTETQADNIFLDNIFLMDQLVSAHCPLDRLPDIKPSKDLALLPYTGGTTGVPKGAMLTHRNLVVDTWQFKEWFSYEDGHEVFIAALPLFHIGGIAGVMNVPLACGATIVLFNRFDALGVPKAIQDYRATRFLGVPTMYIALLNQPDVRNFDLSSLKASRTSAAPLPAAVKEAFDALVGHEVLVEGYGLTETSPLTHVNPLGRAVPGSIGVPLPDTDARIVDPEDGLRELPIGDVGELVVKGPQVMQGYWGRPEATADAIRDGWLYTGDLAKVDEDGYFFVVDRKKDVINAAGFKVWPREVEEVLYQHPMVHSAAVIGVPDSYRGETVKAVVVLKDGHSFEGDDQASHEIAAFCRRSLASFKVPRILEFSDSLPVSAAGKVLRRVLRDAGGGEAS